MTNFTIINLKDLEDMAPKHGHSDMMQSRFASKDLELKESGLGYQILSANAKLPFKHKHKMQEEVFLILSGTGKMILDQETIKVKPLDVIRVGADVVRSLKADNKELAFVIFGAPATKDTDYIMV